MTHDERASTSTGSQATAQSRTISRRQFGAAALGTAAAGVLAPTTLASRVSAASVDQAGQLPANNTMVVAYEGDPATLDPEFAFSPQSQEIIQNVYKSLVDYGTKQGPTGILVANVSDVKPILADHFSVSGDGRTYTFALRQGIRNNYGHEMTTADVLWSFQSMFNSGGAGAFLLSTGAVSPPVSHAITVLDTYTFQLHADHPTPVTLEVLQIWIESILDSKAILPHGTKADPYGTQWLQNKAAGYGPYYISQYTKGQQLVLSAREMSLSKPPALKQVIFKMVPSPADRASLIESGAVDMAEYLAPKDAAFLKGKAGVNLISTPFVKWVYVGINTKQAPLDNKLVRQALNYASPTADIVRVVYHGEAAVPHSYMPALYPGANTSYYPYQYNPGKAKALLQRAGYGSGLNLTLPYDTSEPTFQDVGVILQSAWKEVGITLTLQPLTSAGYANLLPPNKLTTPLFLESDFSVVPDPYYTLGLFFGTKGFHNFGHFSNPVLDAALARGAFERNAQRRLQIIHDAQVAMTDDAPWIVLAYPHFQIALRDNVKGWALYWDGLTRFDALSK